MAKGNLFLSQARGKIGSVVFYRQDGQQVSRVYTDQVKNPRSDAQNAQRAIFYTASRWAAGAKYLIEQGQEGIPYGQKSRNAFMKRALRDIRLAYLNGENQVLNVKGNPYLQPCPISLTSGSLPSATYQMVAFTSAQGVSGHTLGLNGIDLTSVETDPPMTLQEFFNIQPALGLGKQLTLVWLKAESMTPQISGNNFRTSLHWSEIVFASDEAALSKPVFANGGEDYQFKFNPEVLAPSWGGTDTFPVYVGERFAEVDEYSSATSDSWLAAAVIVSDYSNNKWSRSYAPFVVNPDILVDLEAIIATYASDSSAISSTEYLDQGDSEGQAQALSPSAVKVKYRTTDGNVETLSITRKASVALTLPTTATLLDINVEPRAGVTYTTDSVQVNSNPAMTGTATIVGGTYVWSAEMPLTQGQRRIIITTPDGAIRTIMLTVQSV